MTLTSTLKGLQEKIKFNESTISMFLGALVVLVIGVLIFNYFRGVNQRPVEEKASEGEITEAQTVEEIKLDELPAKYQVKQADSLWKIAEQVYGSGYNWVDIAEANDLENPDLLTMGQELTIPQTEVIRPFGKTIDESSYTVQEGDCLWGVAVRAYGDGYRWPEIAQANNLEDPDIIHVGNSLTIPR